MNLNYLRSYSVESQLTFWGRGHEAISWSVDNQVALVHKKGVNIYECSQSPGAQKRPPALAIFSSRIDLPSKSHAPNTGDVSASDIMSLGDKQHVFDLVRDHILRPHEYDKTTFNNYITNACWSPVPIYRGLNVESRCFLGVLSAAHQLVIYRRRERRFTSELWTEPWEVVIDITSSYNKHLCDIWNKEKEKSKKERTKKGKEKEKEPKYDTYKKRLYQLAITNFLWIPQNPEYKHKDEVKGVFTQHLMTFHANGDACIWKIFVSKTEIPEYSASVVYKIEGLIEDSDIVSSTCYLYVSEEYGILVIGTNKGKLISYRVENGTKGYDITDEKFLWDEDMIRVEHIYLQKDENNKKLDIFGVKNPNILLAATTRIKDKKICGEQDFSVVKVPHGAIVGFSILKEGTFLVTHEPGKISLVSYSKGKLDCVENSAINIFDTQKTNKKKDILLGESVHKLEKKERKMKQLKDSDKRLIFQGLALSPNKTLLCTARTIGVYYDHLQIRKPTQLVFYSLLPQEHIFERVTQLYAENDLSLLAISDVLVPFRNILRGKDSVQLFKDILSWAVPLSEKSTADLRLLLWCLKVAPKSDPKEWEFAQAEKMFNPESLKKLIALDALYQYRLDVITDRIISRRCVSLIKAVLHNQKRKEFSLEVELNKQSLHAIYQYLESKGMGKDLPKKPTFKQLPHIPLCFWCKGPVEFPEEFFNYEEHFEGLEESAKTDFDNGEKLKGFKWKVRRHPVKEFGIHKPEICVLSLVPLKFPYRRCKNCLVCCLMEPAFGQLPYCPLCNAMMFPNQQTLDIPDPVEDTNVTQMQINLGIVKKEPGVDDHLFYDRHAQEEMDAWLEEIQGLAGEEQRAEPWRDVEMRQDSSDDD